MLQHKNRSIASKFFIAVILSLWSLSLHATPTSPLKLQEDYGSADTHKTWKEWTKSSAALGTVEMTTPSWTDIENAPGSVGGSYLFDVNINEIATASASSYLYIQLENYHSHGLGGDSATLQDIDINLLAKLKIEVVDDTNAEWEVNLGYVIDYQGFGSNGAPLEPFTADRFNPDWQSLGGNINEAVRLHRENFAAQLPLAVTDDVLPSTRWPAIFIHNYRTDKTVPSSLHLKIYVDDISIIGDTIYNLDFDTAATTARVNYDEQLSNKILEFDDSIEPAKTNIASLSLADPIDTTINAQATAFENTYNNIGIYDGKKSTVSSTFMPNYPSPSQYDDMAYLSESLTDLVALKTYINDNLDGGNAQNKVISYPIIANKRFRYQDHIIESKGALVDTTLYSTMALDEYEPVSFVLQNLEDNDIQISNVTVEGLTTPEITNEFNQDLPADKIDIRTVKQWFTPSTETITVRLTDSDYIGDVFTFDTKIAPEILLHNDNLISIDHALKKNYLNITTGGTIKNQDISDPSILMPHDATVDDEVPFQEFTLPSYNSRQFWITIDSNNIAPGHYSAVVKVNYTVTGSSTVITKSIPLELAVLPYHLADTTYDYGLYYRGKVSTVSNTLNTGFLSDFKSEAQYIAEMKNMLEHGIKYPTQYLTALNKISPLGSDFNNINEINYYYTTRNTIPDYPCDKAFMLGGTAGITPPTTLDNNGNVRSDQSITDMQDAIINNARSIVGAFSSLNLCGNTNPTVPYMYARDEATYNILHEDIQFALDAWKAVQAEGAKVYASGFVGLFDKEGTDFNVTTGTTERIGDTLDTVVHAHEPLASEINKWNNNAKEVYSYNNPQVGVADAGLYRKKYGLYLWQHNVNGVMDYAYQHSFPSSLNLLDAAVTAKNPSNSDLSGGKCFEYNTEGYCSAWNDFDNTLNFDHMFTYPTSNGVVDTIQWEGFREGVDDTRYLAGLQQLLAANPNVSVHNEAQAWLTAAKLDINLDPVLAHSYMQNYISQILQEINAAPILSNVTVVADTLGNINVTGNVSDIDNNATKLVIELKDGSGTTLDTGNVFPYAFSNVPAGIYSIDISATDFWSAIATHQTALTLGGDDLDKDGIHNSLDSSPLVIFSPNANGINISHNESFDDPEASNIDFVDSETLHMIAWNEDMKNSRAVATYSITYGGSTHEDALTNNGDGTFSGSIVLANLNHVGDAVLDVSIKQKGVTYNTPTQNITISSDPNTAPTVTIIAPANDSTYNTDEFTTLSCSISDAEDINLLPNCEWESDIDGDLGTGENIEVFLSDGQHMITARITDSGNRTGSDSINVTVTANCPDLLRGECKSNKPICSWSNQSNICSFAN